MSRARRDRPAPTGGFPRVSGDEPLADAYGLAWTVFSPRERG